MAQFVFCDLAEKAGRASEFAVSSAAVSDEEIYNGVGNPVYPPVRRLLCEHGIDCSGKRARLLTREDAARYDLFVCMDTSNLTAAARILGQACAHKCVKLLSFCGEDADVSDPWYTRDFDACYRDVLRGCTAMLQNIR